MNRCPRFLSVIILKFSHSFSSRISEYQNNSENSEFKNALVYLVEYCTIHSHAPELHTHTWKMHCPCEHAYVSLCVFLKRQEMQQKTGLSTPWHVQLILDPARVWCGN